MPWLDNRHIELDADRDAVAAQAAVAGVRTIVSRAEPSAITMLISDLSFALTFAWAGASRRNTF